MKPQTSPHTCRADVSRCTTVKVVSAFWVYGNRSAVKDVRNLTIVGFGAGATEGTLHVHPTPRRLFHAS